MFQSLFYPKKYPALLFMSERFEQEIRRWYELRPTPLSYLNLEFPESSTWTSQDVKFQCFGRGKHKFHTEDKQLNLIADQGQTALQNLEVIHDRASLFYNVFFKRYIDLREQLEKDKQKQESELLKVQIQVDKILQEVEKFGPRIAEIEKQLKVQSKRLPLTKEEVRNLVAEIAAQPKLVEEQALKLTDELTARVKEVTYLVKEVKDFLHS